MNSLDLFIGIPILWFGYKGFQKGFIAGFLMVAALLLGLYISIRFSVLISQKLSMEGGYGPLVVFLVCFLSCLVLAFIVGKWAEGLMDLFRINFINKILGFLMGSFKVILLMSVCVYFLNQTSFYDAWISKEKRAGSFLYKALDQTAPFLFKKMEELSVKDRIKEADAQVNKKLSKASSSP